jgi:alanine dehydrogenase
MTQVRFLSARDMIQALPMPDAIAAMKSAFAQLATGKANMPLRARTAIGADQVSLAMPAYLNESQALAVKIVNVFPDNVQRNKPIIHAVVNAFDAETGELIGIMEGRVLTAIRTGAGAGAATDVLARRDARTVAIIGSGVQARTQLQAVCAVRAIEQVYVYSPTLSHAQAFAQEMAGQAAIPAAITVAESPQQAVATADIVCTATTASQPVFDGHDLKAGAHVNGVGSYTPTMQEIDEWTLQHALITVDSRESVLAEAGEIIIAMANGTITEDDIHAEIGAIIAGQRTGRTSDEQITYFKSCGVAVQDAAAATIAIANANRHDLGTLLDL